MKLILGFTFLLIFGVRASAYELNLDKEIQGLKEVDFPDQDRASDDSATPVIYEVGYDSEGNKLLLKIKITCANNDCDAHFFLSKTKEKSVNFFFKYLFSIDYYGSFMSKVKFYVSDNLLAIETESNGAGFYASGGITFEKIQLSPLRLIKKVDVNGSVFDSENSYFENIDYLNNNAERTVSYEVCNSVIPDDKKDQYPHQLAFYEKFSTQLIPMINISANKLENWHTFNFEKCSLVPKYVKISKNFYGKYKVMGVKPNIFIIEALKDKFINNGKNWIHNDHIEIWMSRKPEDSCYNKSSKKANSSIFELVQWGVNPVTGKVTPGFGEPKILPEVEIYKIMDKQAEPGLRLKVTVPNYDSEKNAISFSLVEGDGKSQNSMVSSSDIQYGNAFTLGDVFQTNCELANNSLAPMLADYKTDQIKNLKLPDETDVGALWPEKIPVEELTREQLGCENPEKNISSVYYKKGKYEPKYVTDSITISERYSFDGSTFEKINLENKIIASVESKNSGYDKFEFTNQKNPFCIFKRKEYVKDQEGKSKILKLKDSEPLEEPIIFNKFQRTYKLSNISLNSGKYKLLKSWLKRRVVIDGIELVRPEECKSLLVTSTNETACSDSGQNEPIFEVKNKVNIEVTIYYQRNQNIDITLERIP